MEKYPLILASSSPSRHNLLSSLGLSFFSLSPDINEDPYAQELPQVYVQRISREKAQHVVNTFKVSMEHNPFGHKVFFVEKGKKYPIFQKESSGDQGLHEKNFQDFFQKIPLILSGDTIGAVGRRILRKAQNDTEAYNQLILLSGRSHRIYSAVTLYNPETEKYCQRLVTTFVKFKVLEKKEIQQFVDSLEWQNVAIYRLGGFISRFIRAINGQPSTIEGLPLFETYQLLRGNGVDLGYFS